MAECRDVVFKYGPLRPVIKYGPTAPKAEIVETPRKRKLSVDKETKAILKQIAACLKKINKLLDKTEPKTIVQELGPCVGELSLLYLRLNDLQKPGSQKSATSRRPKRGRDAVIVYIVTAPAKRPRKDK